MCVRFFPVHANVCVLQLNNAVSGALDRLHYEKDPCVRYDNARKLWIYLHRGRSEEEFGVFSPLPSHPILYWPPFAELIHWASEVAAKQRKYFMMSRARVKPVGTLRVQYCT